ncbi:MAG: hypothetical protein HYY85_14110 [Deltaproteobacteria bacterium]|nr:hypothetical protein [Deltaproteobacteria bacterium]
MFSRRTKQFAIVVLLAAGGVQAYLGNWPWAAADVSLAFLVGIAPVRKTESPEAEGPADR